VESEKRKNAEVVTDINDIRSNFELEKQKLQQQVGGANKYWSWYLMLTCLDV